MREIFRLVYELVIDNFTLFESPINNYIAFGIIGAIAYVIAYRLVGHLYDSGIIDGGLTGLIVHWIIRILVAVFLIIGVSIIIWIYKIIISVPIFYYVFGIFIFCLFFEGRRIYKKVKME